MGNQFFVRNLGVFRQCAREVKVGRRILVTPESGGDGGDD